MPDSTAAAGAEVPPEEQEAIGDVMEAFIDAVRQGNPDALRRLFAARAVITIGLRQGSVDELRPYVTPVVVTIEEIKSLYKQGGRIHVRLAVRLSEPATTSAVAAVDGHVHVVFVREEGRGWVIGSLRYRKEGQPARLETLSAS